MQRKRKLYTNEACDLSPKEIRNLYKSHINPGIAKVLNLLGFDKNTPVSAEGIMITDCKGRQILDMTGGMCVLNLGHNHPRILAARERFSELKMVEVDKAFLSPYVAALSNNLSVLSPGDLDHCCFCNSGAEANEGAMIIAEQYQNTLNRDKKVFVHTAFSFHGKTHATLSLSAAEDATRSNFKPIGNCCSIPLGDWRAFEDLIRSRSDEITGENDIAAIILEAINSKRVIIPPEGYLENIRRLCDEHDILMIIDEVFLGFCRTGKMFAFEHTNVIPDIFTVAKSLGGGKATVGAYIVRKEVFQSAITSIEDHSIHESSFSGMGEECYTAIESLNVMMDERLADKSCETGNYLTNKLLELKLIHPGSIKDVKGIGLLISLELRMLFSPLIRFLSRYFPSIYDTAGNLVAVMTTHLMFHDHKVLVMPGEVVNSLLITPALIIKREEVDEFVSSLDLVLSKGRMRMLIRFMLSKIGLV